ncbi:uncharacterized protein LOC129321773 isoform X2 [Prosopis cineraria]|uniref:uncharacterized protein LOC129321773 isoform X2 n=1 Tax=Prosopis cineraria TaxID=364024 RepID=UPI00240EB3E4|nr:uncharacterized protein LOC129321773 isoform X2 [Prosopis cineraria]
MARRSSSKVAGVSQVCETGCSSRLCRILNFREGQTTRRLVSNTGHSNIHAIDNVNSGSSPDVLAIVDEKCAHNHAKVNSKRSYHGCKSISCVKVTDQVTTVQGNEATNKVVTQNFINWKSLRKDGAISQPHQFFDALQILYPNKELLLKIQDENSQSVNEQYQAGQKMLTRFPFESKWINSQRSYATQRETPYAGCHCPLHSPGTYNVPSVKHSHFPFSHARGNLRHAMGLRKKGRWWETADKMLRKLPYSCQGIKDGDKAQGLESVGRKSVSSVHFGFGKGGKLSLDFKERERMKIRDFMLCRGQNAVSAHESCGRNITRTSVSPSLQNKQNMHVESTENLSEILNCRIEEQNNEPPAAAVKTVKNDLHSVKEIVERSPPDSSYAYYGISTGFEKFIKSGSDLHPKGIRHMDVPSEQGSRNMHSPTQSFDVDITSEGNGPFMDSPNVVDDLSSSPEVASSSSSSSQSADDPTDMRNIIDERLSAKSATKQVMRGEITNPPTAASQPDELPIQTVNGNSKEHHSVDLTRSSSGLVDDLITSRDMSVSGCDGEILRSLSLKWDELVMKCELPDHLLDPSAFEELKRLTNQLSYTTILFDYVMEVFMERYQHLCRFPHHISIEKPNVQAYVLKRIMVHEVKKFIDLHYHQHHRPPPRTLEQLVEKELNKRRSWLNVQVDIDDIATEVQEDVLQSLILEIISEMDTREA